MEQPLQDLGARPPPRIARDEGGEAIAADDAVADRADAADDEGTKLPIAEVVLACTTM